MNNNYLCTLPDTVKLDREELVKMLKRYRHYRNLAFGFSRKHTKDIVDARKQMGEKDPSHIPSNLYDVPVVYDTDVTYIKQSA